MANSNSDNSELCKQIILNKIDYDVNPLDQITNSSLLTMYSDYLLRNETTVFEGNMIVRLFILSRKWYNVSRKVI
jgi:hypothetical protein